MLKHLSDGTFYTSKGRTTALGKGFLKGSKKIKQIKKKMLISSKHKFESTEGLLLLLLLLMLFCFEVVEGKEDHRTP